MKAALTERGLSPFLPFLLGCAGLFCTLDTFATEMSDHADVADAVVLGEEDLADRAEILRNRYRRMTPGDVPLVQDVGVWPAAWEEFSPVWNGAAAERELGTWMVPVEAEKDGTDTVLRDGNGVELWRGQTDFSKDGTESVVLTGALVAEDDWALYRAARDVIERRAAASKWGDGGGMRGTNGACTNGLHFVLAEGNFATNPPELHVGLAWTNNAMVDVFAYGPLHLAETNVVTYTNDENAVVTATNVAWHSIEPTLTGYDNAWEWIGAVAVGNTGTNVFVDNGFPANRGIVRYYAAAEAVDSDGDGLNDGMEKFVWHTDPLTADTDGDGAGDGVEATLGFDPKNAEDCPKVTIHATLYNPEGTDTGKEWVELYSASKRDVDFGGIRLEVGRSSGWTCAVEFPAGTILPPGRRLLVGESGVTNANVTAVLNIPNAWTNEAATGLRLRWGSATNGTVLDTVFIGGGVEFNTSGLDETGWLSTNSVWAHSGSILERRFPGVDSNCAEDWHEMTNRPPCEVSMVLDFDGDGLPDGAEWTGSANPWYEATNPWNADSDGDHLDDYAECMTYGTNPNTWATDEDIYPWMEEGTSVTNWPGSDFYEVQNGWNPFDPDENTNGIPDSWEMALYPENVDDVTDSDGDGVSNLTELIQNSNPKDPLDSTGHDYVLHYESSLPGWRNGGGDNDCGLGGWIKVCFSGFSNSSDDRIGVAIFEGNVLEEFTVEWIDATDPETTRYANGSLVVTSASPGENAVLLVKDAALHPNFVNTLGGEHNIIPLHVDLDIDGTAEPEEGPRGGFVPVNADNDNGSVVTDGIPATRDFQTDDYLDDDLVAVSLATSILSSLGGEFRLSKTENGRGRIKVWNSPHKDAEITLPASWVVGEDSVPATLWVEGVREGASLRDCGLSFSYVQDGGIRGRDTVLLTVTPVLKILSATADTTQPDLRHSGEMWLAANGGMSANGTPAIQFRAEVEAVPRNPEGAVRLIQHAWVENLLENGLCFIGYNGIQKKGVLNSPFSAVGLVDGDMLEFHFYGPADPSSIVNTNCDTPELGVYQPGIWPFHDGEVTQVGLRTQFRLSAVWRFEDGSIYFLGRTSWDTCFHGALMRTEGRVTFEGNEDNRTTGSSRFDLDNTDCRTSLPIAATCMEYQNP